MILTFLYFSSVFSKFSVMSMYHILNEYINGIKVNRFPEKLLLHCCYESWVTFGGPKQQLGSCLEWKVLPHSPASVRCSPISTRLERFGGPSCAHPWPLPPGTLCAEGPRGSSSMARCSLFGDDFISTFDESMYSFAGDCSYLLAGDCQKHSFSLIGESGALKGGTRNGRQPSSALACRGPVG